MFYPSLWAYFAHSAKKYKSFFENPIFLLTSSLENGKIANVPSNLGMK